MTLGQKLKEVRKRFGLSQEALASIMNVSRQAITKWENDDGMPDISNLQELSKVFGLSVTRKLNLFEEIFNLFSGGDYFLMHDASDLSPFYLAVKDDIKLLINIKDWCMKVYDLPSSTNTKKFVYDDRKFLNCGRLK